MYAVHVRALPPPPGLVCETSHMRARARSRFTRAQRGIVGVAGAHARRSALLRRHASRHNNPPAFVGPAITQRGQATGLDLYPAFAVGWAPSIKQLLQDVLVAI